MADQSLTLSRPCVSVSPDLTPELRLEGGKLLLELRASRRLPIVELQGPRELLQAYGATKPTDFEQRWFADDAEVPAQMMDEVAFTNRSEFRWGCNVPMKAGAVAVISIPNEVTKPPPLNLGIVSVVYEYSRFFGLWHRKLAASIAVGARKNTVHREARDA